MANKSSFAKLGRLSDVLLLVLISLASGPKQGYAMMEDILAQMG